MIQTKTKTSKISFPTRKSSEVILKLPYPPSINNYYGRTRTGKVYIKTEGQTFRQVVVESLREIPETGRTLGADLKLQVWVEAHMPDRRRRDLDNIKKALLDALTHAGVYKDDSQIDDLRVIRQPPSPDHKGFVRVHISIL